MKGFALKDKLLAARIKQVELANKLGMSKQGLSNVLNSESHVSSELLERICVALGCSMSFFYPSEDTVINNNTNNIRKQTAHNISNGSGSITENAKPSDDMTRMLMEQNALLMKQVADLMEMLKAKM